MRRAFLLAGACGVVSIVVSACMARPVATTEPQTSNLYVEPIRNDVIDKIDLLFMIDNSQSMADKQRLLAKAVPTLVDRLVVPRCLNAAGEIRPRTAVTEPCPAGFAPEFRAVNDIHIGVITSSLGSHGAPDGICKDAFPLDDHARLLPSVRPGLASYDGKGFLAWDLEQKRVPPGENNSVTLGAGFSDMVQKAGETGCGFEASLESWYRFLIDPEPPLQISNTGQEGRNVAIGVDAELLKQRQDFLRPDSLVAIVMLTDENDCSVRDDEFGNRIATSENSLPRATSACSVDPNDRCCGPCIEGAVAADCLPIASDPACKAPADPKADSHQLWNLRCMQNKRRFGYDFLYPTSRYVDALTQPQVRRRSDGQMVENPLFAKVPGKARREQGLVFLAGIVGVPWQDIADEASLSGPGLRYLTADELTAKGRWDAIAGDSSKNLLPTDPFMQESFEPRKGTNPVVGVSIGSADSTDPGANPINGHEQKHIDVTDGGDLQYACTFKLEKAQNCNPEAMPPRAGSCDCDDALADGRNRPLCQPPGGGPAGTTQYFGKAYPGLRHLEVLKGIGDSAIVASICPKVLTQGQPGYGYEPAVDAIVNRLKIVLGGRCPPRPLAVQAGSDGKLPCVVVEALDSPDACGCMAAGRKPASEAASKMVTSQLRDSKACDAPSTPACSSYCFCEIAQAEGDTRTSCLNDLAGSEQPGYCYVDPFGPTPVGNPELVKDCSPTSQRLIRFVGRDTPAPGATAYIACLAATLH